MTPREHRIHVRRSARFYTLGEPGPALKECWLVCHGYGQLASRFAQSFEPIASPQRCLIFPEGLSRFYLDDEMRHKVGASWMTKEDRDAEMADYVAYLDAVYEQVMRGDAGVRVTALGFSQGAPTVSRWIAFGRHTVARLILWGGDIPPDLDLAAAAGRFAKLEVVMVRGRQDEYITEKVLRAALKRLVDHRIRHRLVEFEGGHEIDTKTLQEISGS
jgi:predicted esterase